MKIRSNLRKQVIPMDIKVSEKISPEYIEIVKDILDDTEFKKLNLYIQHLKTTRLIHSLNVSYISWILAKKFNLDERVAARAGLLHDFFLYRFSDPKPTKEFQAYYHPKVAARNSEERFNLSEKERLAILSHMFPLGPLPSSREAWIISLADKFCATTELVCLPIVFAKHDRIILNQA